MKHAAMLSPCLRPNSPNLSLQLWRPILASPQSYLKMALQRSCSRSNAALARESPTAAKSSPVGLTNHPPNHPCKGVHAATNPSWSTKVCEWGRLDRQQLKIPEPKQRSWIWFGISIPWRLRMACGFTPSVGIVLVRTGLATMVGLPAASSGLRPNRTDLLSRGSGGLGLVAEKAIQLPLVSEVKGISSYAGIPSSTSLMADGSQVLVACGVSAAATNSAVCPRNPVADGFRPGGGKLVYGLESIMGSGPKIGF